MDTHRKTFAILVANLCDEAGVTADELASITFIEFATRLMRGPAAASARLT